MYFFSQHRLKNLKISYVFLVISSLFACSLQKQPMVTSLADVTNLPAVISLFSAISSCSSSNSQICLTRGGALFLVLSVTFSSLGVRNGPLLLLLAAATFFHSMFGPLALLVELVIVRSMLLNDKLAVKWVITR